MEEISPKKERDCFFDNLRLILMFFVILCHGLETARASSIRIVILHETILCFVMPMFVFVTGFFSKKMADINSPRRKRIINFIVLYLIWQPIEMYLNSTKSFFMPTYGNWFLVCLIVWNLILPSVSKIKTLVVLCGALVAGTLVAIDPKANALFQFSRMIIFFFYFYLGYSCPWETCKLFESPEMRKWEAVALTIAIIFCVGVWIDLVPLGILHGNKSYADMKLTPMTGVAMRIGQYAVSTLFGFGLLSVVPRRKLKISVLGTRTLPIYLIHMPVYAYLIKRTDIFKCIIDAPGTAIIFALMAAMCIFVFGNKWTASVFDKFMNISFEKLKKE